MRPLLNIPDRTRTCNLLLRRQALYPLSYGDGCTSLWRAERAESMSAGELAGAGGRL